MLALQKILLKTIAINVLIVIILFVAVSMIKSDIQGRADQIAQLNQQRAINSQAAELVVALQNESQKAAQYSTALNQVLLGKDQLLNFPADAEKMAQQNNINSQVTFGGENPVNGMAESTDITMTLGGKANLDNFLQFLKILENSRYSLKLDSIDFNQGGQIMRANLTGQVYSFQ